MSETATTPISFRDPVIVISITVWAVMVSFFVWLICTQRTAGKQVAWRTIWAFGFMLITLIGVQVLTGDGSFSLETWHT